MFYRYEAKRPNEPDDAWKGICQAMTPDHSRKTARFLKDPKWYEKNPDTDSRCWFTQFGYDKYHETMEKIIDDCIEWYYELDVRILMTETLEDVVMQGKIQCITVTSTQRCKIKIIR